MSKLEPGVLLKEDIIELNIISENPTDRCFKPASYDLRIGDDSIDPGAGVQDSSQRPLRGKKIVVEPFGSLIVSTYEVLQIPDYIVGKFNIRIKQALRGLFVQMGTQVEPGYHGRLFAVLNNITAQPIALDWEDDDEKGLSRERLFTIEFFTTTGSATVPKMEPLLDIRKFVNSSKFARSSISSVVKDVDRCRQQIVDLTTAIEEQQDFVLKRVNKNFSVTLNSLKTEWDAVKSVNEALERLDGERTRNIERQYNSAIEDIARLEAKLVKDVEDVRSTRRQLVLTVGGAGLFLLFLAAMVPFFISYALDQSNSWWERGTIETYKAEMGQMQAELDALKDAAAPNDVLDSLAGQVLDLRSTIIDLQAKIDYNQTVPSAEGSPSQVEQ